MVTAFHIILVMFLVAALSQTRILGDQARIGTWVKLISMSSLQELEVLLYVTHPSVSQL